MAILKTSIEANYDTGRTPDGHGTKRLIGARATALPKNETRHLTF